MNTAQEISDLRVVFEKKAKSKHLSPVWSDVYWSIVKELDHLELMHKRTELTT